MNNHLEVLSFIVSPTEKEAQVTFKSLMRQTLHTGIYSVIGIRDGSKFAGEIVSKTVNSYLKYIDLGEYDFLLKSDNDVIYPKDFLEVNCREDYDLMGVGAGLLIKVEPFIKYCNGRFAENDLYDTILFHVFKKHGLKVLGWNYVRRPVVFRKMSYSVRRMLNTGKLMFRFGAQFKRYAVNCFFNGFRESPFQWFCILGFVCEFITTKL